jgi:hypothetical protein
VEIEETAPGHGGGAAGRSWGLTGLGRRRELRRRSGGSRRRPAETEGSVAGARTDRGLVVGSWWARGVS